MMLLLLLLPKRAMLQLRSHALLLYTRLPKAPSEFFNRRIIQGRVEHALNLNCRSHWRGSRLAVEVI